MRTMNKRAAAIISAGVLMIGIGAVGASSATANGNDRPVKSSSPPPAATGAIQPTAGIGLGR
jgi:hypothetical protein